MYPNTKCRMAYNNKETCSFIFRAYFSDFSKNSIVFFAPTVLFLILCFILGRDCFSFVYQGVEEATTCRFTHSFDFFASCTTSHGATGMLILLKNCLLLIENQGSVKFFRCSPNSLNRALNSFLTL